ncbi:MAG TPA: ImmA/IrrE family metallo-endopeptidase [Massilibacterium sp.]|nr:ImmA/IrrE family metallo-endopeptidase [Massilibacterium sp.]
MEITKPEELAIENVAKKLKLQVVYRKKAFRFGDEIILSRGTKQQEWQLFGHEICHYLVHPGNQLKMHFLFRDLQEYQANHFAYHFCVPTFMLENENDLSIYKVMNLFNVEYDFALKRLEMYERKMLECIANK